MKRKIAALLSCVAIFFATPFLFDMQLVHCYRVSNIVMPLILLVLLTAYFFVVRKLPRYRLWIAAYILVSSAGVAGALLIHPPRWLDYYPAFPEISLILSGIMYGIFGSICVLSRISKRPIPQKKDRKPMVMWGAIMLLTGVVCPAIYAGLLHPNSVAEICFSVLAYGFCISEIFYLKQCKCCMEKPQIAYAGLGVFLLVYIMILALPILWGGFPFLSAMMPILIFPMLLAVCVAIVTVAVLETVYTRQSGE